MEKPIEGITSTISVSLGTRNKLKKLKGSSTYEEFINYLIRTRNQVAHKPENFIELQKFKRKQGIYSFEGFKVLFEYNEYNESHNFVFDISIKTVRQEGEQIPLKQLIKQLAKDNELLKTEYSIYFQILQTAIQQEIEPLFKHKGRFEDYFSWKKEFDMLNLPKIAFEEDVMDKLKNYQYGEGAF